jgi:hypothetical protein
MAEQPISIPIHITPGNLQGIENAQRMIAETKRQLDALQGWEVLPGGGIRRTGPVPLGGATPGIAVPGIAPGAVPLPQMQQATRAVQQHTDALSKATQATRAFFETHTQAEQRQTLQSTLLRIQAMQQLLERGGGGPDLPARLAVLQQRAQALQAAGVTPGGGGGGDGADGADGAGGGGRFGAMVGRAWQGVRGTARGVLGAVAGIGLYQTITAAMEAYQQRARGVIDTGMQLTLSFDQIGATIDTVRHKYQFLAHDSLAAMQVAQRISGRPSTLAQAAPFAAAYGIPLSQATEMHELARRYTGGANPLVTMLALGQRGVGPGITPMGPGALIEEGLSIAQIGAATGVQAPPEFYGRMQGLIGGMGDVYQTPGAQARVYGQLAQGLANAPDDAVLAIRFQALERLRQERVARGLGSTMTIGTGAGAVTADLSTLWGKRVALSAAATQPEIIQAFERAAGELTGTRPELAGEGFERIVGGGQLSLIQSEQLRQRRGQFATLGLPGGPATALGVEEIQARLAARAERPEVEKFLAVVAEREAGLERLGEPLTRISMNLQQAMIGLFDSFDKGTINVSKLKEAFLELDASTKAVVGTLMALGSPGVAGQLFGLSLLGSSAVGSGLAPTPEGSAPFQNPLLLPPGWNFLSPLQSGTPPTQPQRPGP